MVVAIMVCGRHGIGPLQILNKLVAYRSAVESSILMSQYVTSEPQLHDKN